VSKIIEDEEVNQRKLNVKNKFQKLREIVEELEYGN